MNNEIYDDDLEEMVESTGSPQGSRAFDELAIVFVVSPSGTIREQWFTPTCGHAVEQDTCPTCQEEQARRERSRSRFAEQEIQKEAASGLPQLCVCDFPNRSAMTIEQYDAADGHFNQAGGFCCRHYGNTCGYCHNHDH